jgi:hypothetical protein
MDAYNAIAFISCLALGLGSAALVYALLRGSVREVVNNLVKIPEATEFYLRSLALVLVLAALSCVIVKIHVFHSPPAKGVPAPPPHFMEYVWVVADHLHDAWWILSIYLLFYVAVITILAAVLRSREWNTKGS